MGYILKVPANRLPRRRICSGKLEPLSWLWGPRVRVSGLPAIFLVQTQ